MTHPCPDCGLDHGEPMVETPVIVDEVPAVEASVKIAEIEADRDVTIARVSAKVEEGWQESRVKELEGQLAGVQQVLAQLAPPPPEPVPVVVEEAPPADPVMSEPVVEPPPVVDAAPQKAKKANPFWR